MKYIGAAFLTLATMLCGLTIAIAKEGDHLGRYEWAVPYLAVAICVCVVLGIVSLVRAGRQQEQKSSPPPLPSPFSQIIKQEASPRIDVNVGADARNARLEEEHDRNEHHDKLVKKYLDEHREPEKQVNHLVEITAPKINLEEQEVAASFERLYKKGILRRSTLDTKWDFVYWLRE